MAAATLGWPAAASRAHARERPPQPRSTSPAALLSWDQLGYLLPSNVRSEALELGQEPNMLRPFSLLLMLMLLFLLHQGVPVGAPKLSSFRKKTETPAGAHALNEAGSADGAGGGRAATVPSVREDTGSKETNEPRTFAPAKEFEAKLAAAKNRARQGGKQAIQARAEAKEHLESLVTAAEQLQRAGDLTGAGVAFDRALEAEPTSPRALANRAKVHYDLTELEAAERLCLLRHHTNSLSFWGAIDSLSPQTISYLGVD